MSCVVGQSGCACQGTSLHVAGKQSCILEAHQASTSVAGKHMSSAAAARHLAAVLCTAGSSAGSAPWPSIVQGEHHPLSACCSRRCTVNNSTRSPFEQVLQHVGRAEHWRICKPKAVWHWQQQNDSKAVVAEESILRRRRPRNGVKRRPTVDHLAVTCMELL